MRKYISLGIVVSFLLLSPLPVFANSQQEVLGAEVKPSDISMPPTTEGPGLLLPDSPLFFLDRLKQNLRILFAFSPETKAKVYMQIAGERYAELRFMLARNNKEGIAIDLQGIQENVQDAADSLTQAQLSGKNVVLLAKNLNTYLREKQEVFNSLEDQAAGELKAQIHLTQITITYAKSNIENALPQDELANTLNDDLQQNINEKFYDIADSAKMLTQNLQALQQEASGAARNSLQQRKDELDKAISLNNSALAQIKSKEFDAEKRKQEALLTVQTQATQQAVTAIAKAQEAAAAFQKATEASNALRNQQITSLSFQTPDDTNTSFKNK